MLNVLQNYDDYQSDEHARDVRCTAHRVSHNQLAAVACGPEQTGITYAFTDRVAAFPGLNIVGMTTNRVGGVGAGSYMLVGDLSGSTKQLSKFHKDILANPWLEPHGKRFLPASTASFDIFAPDRPKLLRDITRVMSVELGLNIETLVNGTHPNMFAAFEALGLARDEDDDDEEERWEACQDVVSVTSMKLELPSGTDAALVKKRLSALGKGWVIHLNPTPATSLSSKLGFGESRN